MCKSLLLMLLLGFSLWFSFLHALKCFNCHHVNADGVCESGETVCHTRGRQQCILRKVYEGSKLLYGYQGCGTLCASISLFKGDTHVDFECCNDTDLCNKFQRVGP